jgi:protein associated with RNAse G/E
MPALEPRPPAAPPVVTEERVRILSTKWDGSPHNDYYGFVIAERGGLEAGPPADGTPQPLRLLVPAGHVIRSYRGEYLVRVAFTALFWPGADRWWNVEHNHWTLLRQDGRSTSETYANVSTPARLEGDTLHWIDLDLDVIVRDGAVSLLDEDEFEEHGARWSYPDDLVRQAREAAEQLLALAEVRAHPFDRHAHVWLERP